MRLIPVVLLSAFLAVSASVAAAPIDLTFQPPGSADGQVTSSGLTWILVVATNSSTLEGIVEFGDNNRYSREKEVLQAVQIDTFGGFRPSPVAAGNESATFGAETGTFTGAGPFSFLVAAREIEFDATHASGSLEGIENLQCLNSVVPEESLARRFGRFELMCPGPSPGLVGHHVQSSVRIAGASLIEAHGVSFECTMVGKACPDGLDRNDTQVSQSLLTTKTTQLQFHRFSGDGEAGLEFHLRDAYVAAGGMGMNLNVSGSLRLPLASATSCPGACPQDETVFIEGQSELRDLQLDGDAIRAAVDTESTAIRIDERLESPWSGDLRILGIAGAGLGVGLILKLLLAPLFTRLTKEQALEHPRRKQIFEYIQQHPGANFREVARNTGIAAGTVRHHLNVLERSGQVVEHNHGSTVRLFENHGKFDQNWSDLVLLREPALGKLHEWLKDHPNSPQKAVLEAMEAEQWSRSTTQHRLARLVDGGVVSIRLQGRLKMYTVVDKPAAAKPPGLPAPMGAVSA